MPLSTIYVVEYVYLDQHDRVNTVRRQPPRSALDVEEFSLQSVYASR
jgi:hypothetical protein